MDQQTNGADIIGATASPSRRGRQEGKSAPTPKADAADAFARRLEHENTALDGLVTLAIGLRNSGRASSQDAQDHVAALHTLEQELAALRWDLRDQCLSNDGLRSMLADRDDALRVEADKIRLLEVERDNLKAAREAQDKALRQQDTNLAQLRADLTRTLADLRTATEAATANAAAANAAKASAEDLAEQLKARVAEIADIRKRQQAARKAGKNRKRAAA